MSQRDRSDVTDPTDTGDTSNAYDPMFGYDFSQSLSQIRQISQTRRTAYDDQYGRIHAFFKRHPDRFSRLQRWLKQARIRTTYDQYLVSSVRYTVGASVSGAIFGIILTVWLSDAGLLASLSFPFHVSLPGVFTSFVASNRVLVFGIIISFASSTLLSLITWFGRYYYPRAIADIRRRNINIFLPHAIVYMYALSQGGMDAFDVIKATAETDDIYGEVTNELDLVVRDVELFGNDLMMALQNTRDLTPSDSLEQFLDDLLNVLDSGSDFGSCLERESNTYRRKAQEEQENFRETLILLSEFFIVGFVAAPLLLIITLLIISLIGGKTLFPLMLLVYIGLPISMLAFIAVIKILSRPFADPDTQIPVPRAMEAGARDDTTVPEPRTEAYKKHIRRKNIHTILYNPFQWIADHNPMWSIAITVPLAGLGILLLLMNGSVPSTWSGVSETPIRTTIGFVLVPFYILGIPVAFLHELKRRRKRRIASRFPDMLEMLSSMNQMDIQFPRALEMISTEVDGRLSMELRKVRNDIRWTHDVERALLSFANRLRVPQITRTMKLLSAGSYSSGDLSKILDIAAEDTRNRYQTEHKRRQEMSAYVVIVIVGFLVFVGVFLVVDQSYLTQAAQIRSGSTPELSGGLSVGTAVPVSTYRTLLFHSALIQGVGSGLLAGELTDGNVLSGLKYCLLLVTITLAAFTVV